MKRPAYILLPQPFGDDPAAQKFLLIRYGHTDYTKGQERGGFDFDEKDADAVIKDFQDRGKDLVVDYDHATLSGGEAPASGWIKNLEKGEDGLYATAEWTAKAEERLNGREYRYHSPVIFFSSKGRPKALHSVALTNHPAFHGYPALAADDLGDGDVDRNTNKQGGNMNQSITALASALGVAVQFSDGKEDEAATVAKITEKIEAMKAATGKADAFLQGQNAKTFDDVNGKIAGMVPASELEAAKAELAKFKSTEAVAKAFADGKLVEAQRKWAEEYAASNPQAFADFVASAPVVVPGPAANVPTGNPPKQDDKPVEFDDNAKKILFNCGLTPEDVKKADEPEKKEDK